jgi:hypothetical protein
MPYMNHRILFFLFFCFFALAAGQGEDFSSGRIKLVLHEETGRFSLYYITDYVLGKTIPLFFSPDPRTSFFAVTHIATWKRLNEVPWKLDYYET